MIRKTLLFWLFSPLLWAEAPLSPLNYWQCIATDQAKKEWTMQSNYHVTALNRSLALCKKNSEFPRSCRAPRESCEQFINGRTTRPMWQCSSIDYRGFAWHSNEYLHKYDAALAAKTLCRQHSDKPGTCLVNLLTCKNKNER